MIQIDFKHDSPPVPVAINGFLVLLLSQRERLEADYPKLKICRIDADSHSVTVIVAVAPTSRVTCFSIADGAILGMKDPLREVHYWLQRIAQGLHCSAE